VLDSLAMGTFPGAAAESYFPDISLI
jgi:hypothetical protein